MSDVNDPGPLALALRSHLQNRGDQARLAERAGVPPTTLSSWVSGHRTPTLDQVLELEVALGLPTGQLTRFVGFVPTEAAGVDIASPEEAIIADETLSGRDKRMLLDMLARFRGGST